MKLLQRFFSNEASSGIILIVAAVFAMVLANLGATQGLYHAFLNTPVELRIGALDISKNMLSWINDALMAVFFLLVGLEVKREVVQGALAHRQRALFPAIAALGGMVAPALIYLAFNYWDPVSRAGWAIPVATDIAFTLGVLALLGKSVPVALKVFLMALAIIDDLGAIIITIFYASDLSILSLSVSAGAIASLALLNLCNVRRTSIYILVGTILWTAVLKSGVHAPLAGAFVGLFIPIKVRVGTSPARQLEHMLHPWVAFMILPLFAFTNAGVSLQGVTLNGLTSTLPLVGIIVGLFIGKPLGISLFCWLALKLKLASLPVGTTFRQIMALGVLCGIGFTMSIFIASLAFDPVDQEIIVWAKIGILSGSLLSAFLGYALLKKLLGQLQTA